MIVWTITGILSWGTFFALFWTSVLQIEDIDKLSALLLAVLSLLLGLVSAFAESQARQEIAKLRRVSMRSPSIVYAGEIEHDSTDGKAFTTDS